MNFIVVNPDQFYERKDNYEPSSCIKSKYDALLKKYECFLKSNNLYYHKYNKGGETKKRTFPDRPAREPKKTLQSLWNVLNESNYHKICHKLKFLVNESNLTHIVTDILKNAVLHSTYRKYFVIVLNDLISICNKDVAMNTISEFYKDYIANNRYEFPASEGTPSNEYDLFCKKQKHKQMTLNTNLLFMELVDRISDVDINIDNYISLLIGNINGKEEDEYYVDLILNMIIDVCDRYKVNILNCKANVYDSLECIKKHNKSLKNKFLIEKIYTLLGKN